MTTSFVTIIEHFNEHGVYVGCTVQDDQTFDELGACTTTEWAKNWAKEMGWTVSQVIEDEL